ncbi:early endosome antigen 1-like [Brachionus plicatilis]|uniref:Early endosome antigen 1-like n=1 Tax=Brachionus plicatilis TaxID=10195 RepID=A0A3M7T8F3_BRAPC|nr:early endosome antigen 1-like [Brachionus plicatilis]
MTIISFKDRIILENEELKGQIQTLNKTIEELNSLIEENKSLSEKICSRLKTDLEQTKNNLEKNAGELESLKNQKDDALGKLLESNTRIHELVQKEKSQEKKLYDLENEISELRIVEQKIRAELEKLNNDIIKKNSEILDIKKINEEIVSQRDELIIKIDKLSLENEEIKIERDDCDKMRLDAIKKHEIQSKALNQNLASLRTELRQQSERIIQLNKELDDIKGDNLELEANLSNLVDERNQLLTRCLEAEKICENFKILSVEYKRKLEDAQGALHELGREHQTLQVLNHRKSNYKWVDDSLVNDCTQCKKVFSVTNRKHHCRNCGQVFCHECSDYTAQVSSSKKPQRVCKACHLELNE